MRAFHNSRAAGAATGRETGGSQLRRIRRPTYPKVTASVKAAVIALHPAV